MLLMLFDKPSQQSMNRVIITISRVPFLYIQNIDLEIEHHMLEMKATTEKKYKMIIEEDRESSLDWEQHFVFESMKSHLQSYLRHN